ncbi:MAG: GTPase HflX [Planctomycetota bacterium]
MESGQREQLKVEAERAILVAALLPNDGLDPHDPLGELRSLADTAGAIVVEELMQKKAKPDAKTFIGKGKVEELKQLVKAHDAQCVIFENDLSPSQIAKVEEAVEAKVLDRSELILDIFAARARTLEARIQVELAQLEYTYPRLRAMWSHLERIVGGAPAGIGTRGPGEQQLEIDRRIVQRKKSQLKREIADLQARKTRQVNARNLDHYTVGLVGYTNAGKSTLFNTLTQAGTYADDKLFATLSTKTRRWDLGDGESVMLSDTVGFVRNLPHHLVASFKATLEEAIHSDLLLIVADTADPNCQRNLDTVMQVLDDIGATEPTRLVVLNKIDKLQHNAELLLLQQQYPDAVAISAANSLGLDALTDRVRQHARGKLQVLTLRVPHADGKALGFLESQVEVLDRNYENDAVLLKVQIGQHQLDRLQAMNTSVELPSNHTATANSWGR